VLITILKVGENKTCCFLPQNGIATNNNIQCTHSHTLVCVCVCILCDSFRIASCTLLQYHGDHSRTSAKHTTSRQHHASYFYCIMVVRNCVTDRLVRMRAKKRDKEEAATQTMEMFPGLLGNTIATDTNNRMLLSANQWYAHTAQLLCETAGCLASYSLSLLLKNTYWDRGKCLVIKLVVHFRS
jgi:hypothetical protein